MNADVIKKRTSFFYSQNTPVHIRFINGKWLNGIIKELNDELFVINEFKDGPIPIFYIEVDTISPYVSPEDKNKNEIRFKLMKKEADDNGEKA